MPEQIQVNPPRTRSPSSSSSPSSSGQKCKRTTNADLEKHIESLLRSNEMLTQVDVRNKQSLAAQATMMCRLTKRVDMLEVKYSGLKAKHHIACRTIVNHIEEVEEKEKKKEKK
jgi:ribosomal protein L20A (L18A)